MRHAGPCVLSLVYLVGCGGGIPEKIRDDQKTEQVVATFNPDPAYVPKTNDFAALYRPARPTGLVPYVLDLEVYARIYDLLRSGQDHLIPKADQSEIRWVPPGTEIKIVNIMDRESLDIINQYQSPEQRAAQKPWAKVVLVFPGTQETEMNHEKIGFTLIEYLNRPLSFRK